MSNNNSTPSLKQIKDSFLGLPLSEVRKLCNQYAKQYGKQVTDIIDELSVQDLEHHLEELGINDCCPYCGSKMVIGYGKTVKGIQRFHCENCKKYYNRFTGTFLEKTKYDWNTWVEFIQMTINGFTLEKIKKNLEEGHHLLGINYKTIWNWRHKIMCVAMEVPLPKLHGVIQIDETHVHEGQKGSRNLYNPMSNTEPREARKGGRAAEYGPMGAEFVTTICAVDEHGYAITKVQGLGKINEEQFEEEFDKYFGEISVLCTDANYAYSNYANKKGILHYVQPSDYLRKVNGKTKEERKELYEAGEIDRVANRSGRYSYSEFLKFKKQYGLSLNRVNEFHTEFKDNLVKSTHGISAQYVEEYAGWLTFLRNFSIDYGCKNTTTKKDAEDILVLLLKTQTNPLLKEIKAKDIRNLSKPTDRYLKNLMAKTDKIRGKDKKEEELTEEEKEEMKKYKYFIFDDETVGENFSLRDQLLALPLKYLKEMGKDLKIKDWSKAKKYQTYKLRMALEKHPDIQEELKKIRQKYGKSRFSEIK